LDTLDSPVSPREPILTLPGALTAYVGLLVVIHLIRMLLPLDLEYWTIEVFGFIPKRYDQTLLSMPFPGGNGAKIWSFVTYSLLHMSPCPEASCRWCDATALGSSNLDPC